MAQLVKNLPSCCGTLMFTCVHVYEILSTASNLSRRSPICILQLYFWNVSFNNILSSTPISAKWPVSFNFFDKLWVFFVFYVRATCPADLIYLDLISLIAPIGYLEKSTNYESHHCEVFCIVLLLQPSDAQMSSSAPCFRTLLICAFPLKWEMKFYIATKQIKLWFCIF